MANNKKSTFDGLGDLLGDAQESTALGEAALHGNKPVRATRGAAAGCKEGSTRHTYVMPIEMIQDLKEIASYFNRSEVSVVLEFLQSGIDKVKAKYGEAIKANDRSVQSLI